MGFATTDDVVSKLPGQQIKIFKGFSLSVGSPGRWRDLWNAAGTIQGSLSQVLSANQGGTYFVSSHLGAWTYTNPNSVSAESCCIAKVSVWGRVPGDQMLLYDRAWACRGFHSNTNVAVAVASIAFVRSFEAARAELWLTVYTPIGSLSHTITISWIDASGASNNATLVSPFASNSSYTGMTAPLIGIPLGNGGIQRVQALSINSNIGAAGEYGLTIQVPKFETTIGYSTNITDAFGTGLVTVASNECLNWIYYSNTVQFDRVSANVQLIIK